MDAAREKYNTGITTSLTPEERKQRLQEIVERNIKQYTQVQEDAVKLSKKEEKEKEDENIDDDELQRLKNTLLQIAIKDSSILHYNIDKELTAKIDAMDIAELKQRILLSRSINVKKIDNKIASTVIGTCNNLIGKLLGCEEELDKLTEHDVLLRDSMAEIISQYIFDIPAELRLASVYSLHVSKATASAYLKRQKEAKVEQQNEQPTL